MSKTIDQGGPAFPKAACESCNGNPGMSMRQWYAGMALKWMYANPSYDQNTPESIATLAFNQADVMIAHEKKEQENAG